MPRSGSKSDRLTDECEELFSTRTGLGRGGKYGRRLRAPLGDGFEKFGHAVFQERGADFVGLGENERHRHTVTHEPLNEFQIDDLGLVTTVDQNQDTSELRPLREVARDHFLQSGSRLLRDLGKSVAGQIHERPALIDGEKIDQLSVPRRAGDLCQRVASDEGIEQGRFPHVGTSDQCELGPVKRRAVRDVCTTGDEGGGLDVHARGDACLRREGHTCEGKLPDVFAQHVKLHIQSLSRLPCPQIGDGVGMRNDPAGGALRGDVRGGERDAVEADGSFGDDQSPALGRKRERESIIGAIESPEKDLSCRIHVALDKVAAEPVSCTQGALDVHHSTGGQIAKIGHAQGLLEQIKGNRFCRRLNVRRGEAAAIDRDALALHEAGCTSAYIQREPGTSGTRIEGDDGGGGFDESGKHGG